MKYQPTVGLEIHIELNTKTKMFCDCLNDPNERKPNINICPICMGHPGTMPVINKEAVNKVIKTGLALNCHIPCFSKFDRKNYFYPDLPKGYQISQYDKPLCEKGYLEIGNKKIGITRVHLEEDTGRLIHPEGADYSLVDFNRAGIPLMELVTEPDLHSAGDARKFAEELRLILKYLDVSDVDMEKGQMRIEVNVSLSDSKELGTKVEIKNLNSFRAVEKAIEHEIKRQSKILESGKKVVQETRGWDAIKEITKGQREKESAHDYRYFPEPDLPPIEWKEEDINVVKAALPELPQQKRERFSREYELLDKDIEIFVINKDLGEYFEKVISELEPKLAHQELLEMTKLTSNYLITDLQGLLGKAPHQYTGGGLITPENFAEFVGLIHKNTISSKIAKIILPEMFRTGADPSHIIEEKGLAQITDQNEVEKAVREIIAQNQKAVEDLKRGKENAFQFLIGQVMAKTKGRANPDSVKDLLKKTLDKKKKDL